MSSESSTPHVVDRILIVCTGNICRSPYAAYRLQAALTQRGITRIAVDSAGTRAEPQHPMALRISRALMRAGIESNDFQSKPVTRQLVERADLILTAETAHRAAVVRLEPATLGRVFTLRQFARLIPVALDSVAGTEQIHSLPGLVRACSAARGLGQPARGTEDDVEDPWGRSARTYRRSMKSIDRALAVIVPEIAGALRLDH